MGNFYQIIFIFHSDPTARTISPFATARFRFHCRSSVRISLLVDDDDNKNVECASAPTSKSRPLPSLSRTESLRRNGKDHEEGTSSALLTGEERRSSVNGRTPQSADGEEGKKEGGIETMGGEEKKEELSETQDKKEETVNYSTFTETDS